MDTLRDRHLYNQKTYWKCIIKQRRHYVVTVDNVIQMAEQMQNNHTAVPFIKEVGAFKAKLNDRVKTETTPVPKI